MRTSSQMYWEPCPGKIAEHACTPVLGKQDHSAHPRERDRKEEVYVCPSGGPLCLLQTLHLGTWRPSNPPVPPAPEGRGPASAQHPASPPTTSQQPRLHCVWAAHSKQLTSQGNQMRVTSGLRLLPSHYCSIPGRKEVRSLCQILKERERERIKMCVPHPT